MAETQSVTEGELKARDRIAWVGTPPVFSGGDDSQGTELRRTPLPTAEEQISFLEKAEEEKTSAFSVSQEDIDAVLQKGIAVAASGNWIQLVYPVSTGDKLGYKINSDLNQNSRLRRHLARHLFSHNCYQECVIDKSSRMLCNRLEVIFYD